MVHIGCIDGGQVKVAVEAPDNVLILHDELWGDNPLPLMEVEHSDG